MTKLGIAVAATLLVAVVDLSGRHDTVGRTEGGMNPPMTFLLWHAPVIGVTVA